MLDPVVWSAIILDIALWVKSKMAAICPRSNNKLISFLVSTLEFSGMPDNVVLSENHLDIALSVKNLFV